MIDITRLNEILALYMGDFAEATWNNEKYKWVAVKHFQDNWDINADDFAAMLEESLAKTSNLLASMNNFPKGMIIEFAKMAPEEVRSMFLDLFDEGKDYWERISEFKQKSGELVKRHKGAQSYQNENSITTYLWLRYPDRYYIYKYGEVRKVAQELGGDYVIKQGHYADNVRNHLALYDEVNEELRKNRELRELLDANLTGDCYPDPQMRTLTIDFGFYISRYLKDSEKVSEEWFPSKEEYDPGISVEGWSSLLKDPDVFTEGSLQIMRRLKDYGGAATCTQLSVKYGETKNFYNSGSGALARRVIDKTGCPTAKDALGENPKWWPVLYMGRDAGKDEEGSFVWRLRDELSEALDRIDLSSVQLYASGGDGEGGPGHWWLNANPKTWSFADIAIGDAQSYTLYNENGNKRRIFQNFLDAKAGDMIIGYESNPVKQVVAIAKVASEQDGERLYFEKVEGLSNPIDYKALHDCPELEKMEYFVNPQGSLFRLTPGEYEFIMDMVREENPLPTERALEAYGRESFLKDVYMDGSAYDRLCAILMRKKNVILQGAPGVGKTFAARRLAWSIMGEKDDDRIEFVQFHQSYSYEDFIMGYRPEGDGFELKHGVFYRFCQKAANQPDKPFFFIIDEINRGNLSKIFGELFMLVEPDKRGYPLQLLYSDEQFSVPENLCIIGMMNTADRSLAMIDYALRRRFAFYEIAPAFSSKGFRAYQKEFASERFDRLVQQIEQLNDAIERDDSLGRGFRIGHSYLCGMDEARYELLEQVIDFEIVPLLEEYWFDEPGKVRDWKSRLKAAIG